MKAAVICGPADVAVETVDTPTIRDNEILVKVVACGICGSDLHFYKAGPTAIPKGRTIIGHEFSGEVVEVGSAVQGVGLGSRVIGMGLQWCNECESCRQGMVMECASFGATGYGLDGSLAEYVAIPNPMPGVTFFEIPDKMDWEEAAAIEPMTISGYAVDQAQIQPDSIVVVLGAGAIGLGVIQFAKLQGAATVIASEPSAKRLALAQNMGADETIDPRVTAPVEAVKKVTSGKMADVVFECSGNTNAFCQGLGMLRPGPGMLRKPGTMIQVALFERDVHISPELMEHLTTGNLFIRGSSGAVWDKAFETVSQGKVNTKDLITHEFRLDEIKQAFEMQLNTEEAIKVIVKP